MGGRISTLSLLSREDIMVSHKGTFVCLHLRTESASVSVLLAAARTQVLHACMCVLKLACGLYCAS